MLFMLAFVWKFEIPLFASNSINYGLILLNFWPLDRTLFRFAERIYFSVSDSPQALPCSAPNTMELMNLERCMPFYDQTEAFHLWFYHLTIWEKLEPNGGWKKRFHDVW